MSQRTETEKKLLDALENSASRMSNMEAMLSVLTEWDIYADQSLCEEARRERRRHAHSILESMMDLARSYHDEVMGVVDAAYRRDG